MWTQVYDPLGNEWLSVAAAAAPVVVLLGSLAWLGWPAQRAAFAGLVSALAVAIGVYGMPWKMAAASAGSARASACFRSAGSC